MKAILVVDMPESCYECQFQGMGGRDLEILTCSLYHWCVDNPNERPSWCPLKPMPERKPTDFLNYWFNQGWNALHDELAGDEDE